MVKNFANYHNASHTFSLKSFNFISQHFINVWITSTVLMVLILLLWHNVTQLIMEKITCHFFDIFFLSCNFKVAKVKDFRILNHFLGFFKIFFVLDQLRKKWQVIFCALLFRTFQQKKEIHSINSVGGIQAFLLPFLSSSRPDTRSVLKTMSPKIFPCDAGSVVLLIQGENNSIVSI